MRRPRSVFLFSIFTRLTCLLVWAVLVALGIAAYYFAEKYFIWAITALSLVSVYMIFHTITVFTKGIYFRPKRGTLTFLLGFGTSAKGTFALADIQSIRIIEKERSFQFVIKDKSGNRNFLCSRFHRISYWLFMGEMTQFDRLRYEIKQLNQYFDPSAIYD